MPTALLVLALSAFAIGTTEFVIMGLLPEVAQSLSVSIPSAGWLVTGYALGVAVGAPFMAMATARLPRRRALLVLMGFFIIGNLLCAMAASYGFLMVARIVTALCHGAFFGIGSVVAASLAPNGRKARAVALMFTGLTLANVLGVPLGTALGQFTGWRMTFWAVTLLGIVAFAGLWKVLPRETSAPQGGLGAEIAGLANRGLWVALFTTVLFAAAMFTLFTYIAPLLRDVTGTGDTGVTWTLLAMGVGLTLGNLAGGRLADWRLGTALASIFAATAIMAGILHWTAGTLWPAEITLFLWSAATFATVPALQINVVRFGKQAPNLVSTLNISAFNAGNAVGAWIGGEVISRGWGLTAVPVASASIAATAFLLTLYTFRAGPNPATARA